MSKSQITSILGRGNDSQSEALVCLLNDFAQLTGIPVRLVAASEFRTPIEPMHADCHAQQLSSDGALRCLRFHATMRDKAIQSQIAVENDCRMGLWIGALPMVNLTGGSRVLEFGPVKGSNQEQRSAAMRLAEVLKDRIASLLESDFRSTMKNWPDAVVRVVHFIEGNFSGAITMNELARLVGLSPGHLSKVFASTTGHSPMQYLAHIRLQKAGNLLISQPMERVSEIALSSGFESVPHFNRRFREAFGCSPRDYRGRFLAKISSLPI